MTSAQSRDRFLGELSTRRQRILQLADASGRGAGVVLDELNELSEQLISADEELRVQQEELDSARSALLSLSEERDLLLQSSTKAYVVTDERGVVLQSTRAASQLLRQPPSRLAPRPIATWFEVADRRAVRSMISRVRANGVAERASGLQLRRSDGEQVRVDLVAELVGAADEGHSLLRWELLPAVERLHALPAAVAANEEPPVALAQALAATAVELQACRTTDDLVATAMFAALRLVPGARDADLVLGSGPAGAPAGSANAPAGRAAAPQVRTREEPFEGQGRPDDAISVPLLVGSRHLGVLTVHVEEPGNEAEVVLTALGLHVALALHQRAEVHDLEEGLRARQLIGQAVGILAERHQITPDAAFADLVHWSQHLNVKLRSLAHTLVETGREPSIPRRA